MRRADQYTFKVSYDKTFLDGNLKGLTVHAEYGTCDATPWDYKDKTFVEYGTNNRYTVSNYQITRNY